MARRVVGERKGEQQFQMLLVGDVRPIKVPLPESLPVDYRKLLSTWGPGVAFGTLRFADPTEPDGAFAHWQRRLRLHARHLIATHKWGYNRDEVAFAKGTVLAAGVNAAILVTRDREVFSVSSSFAQPWHSFADAMAGIRKQMQRPPLYYRTKPSQRGALVDAIRQDNAPLVDGLMAAVFEEESIAGMLAVTLALVREPDARRYAPYVARAMEKPCQIAAAAERAKERLVGLGEYVSWYASLAADLAAHLEDGSKPESVVQLANAVEPFDVFGGEADPVEIALANAVIAKPDDNDARLVLLDHYQERGQLGLAALVRAYLELLPPETANRYGPMPYSASACEDLVGTWRDTWIALDAPGDPDCAIDEHVKSCMATEPLLRRGIVNWIMQGDDHRLVEEAGTDAGSERRIEAFLILALRSKPDVVVRVLSKLSMKAAAPYLWSAIVRPSSVRAETHEAIVKAFEKLGKLTAERVTDVLTWIADDDRKRLRVAFCLLQDHAKNDRVFEAALRHFVDGSPYTEKVLWKRKADPRVEAMLWAAFEREEAKVLKGGRYLSYSRDYGVLSRFLAKLGHTRAEEAYARYQTKARMDRASMNRSDDDDY